MFTWWQLILVLLLDAWLGDPPGWPHLVRWQGRVITRLEAWLRPGGDSPAKLRLAGGGLVLLVVGGSALAAWGGMALGRALWPPLGLLVGIGLAFQCLAAGQLNREARAAECPLAAGDLPLARRMLARIVGRDTAALAPEGVRRAVIETIAENLNDGVVAPLFYLALLGPAGAVAYKAVNTLDSMLGYRDERYRHFGTAAARLDDLAGFIPARLTALLLVLAAFLLGLDGKGAWRGMVQDHARHKSPNSGWPEAACAGALGVRLGGPNFYGGIPVDKPWLNPAGRDPLPPDLAAAHRLLGGVTGLAGLLALAWLLT